ncbi:MAG: nitroreductase family protein [Methanomassiliicoccales archaeon]|jgi:nitroreductase|nr:nitroreductase family protein [Methanomassiliicoccales archaeon]HOO03161.1 nitroreductase family protein [Methanomassiliicoccales archaeon]HRU11415.1 nitroreductase family protein [Methanomassiliicoccales archaeon]
MEVKEAIRARRSIRRYKRKELPLEVLDRLLEMARAAPSGANRQAWELVVITDRLRLKGLVPICKEQAFIGDCSAFLVGVEDPHQKWAKVDLAIALDHLSLAATEEGLGSCWIGAFDPSRLAEYIGLPPDRTITVCMALGYPDEAPAPRGRKKPEELFSWDRYGVRERE